MLDGVRAVIDGVRAVADGTQSLPALFINLWIKFKWHVRAQLIYLIEGRRALSFPPNPEDYTPEVTTTWNVRNQTPSISNTTNEFWRTRHAAEALSFTIWDLFTQSAMQHYALHHQPDGSKTLYDDGVVDLGVVPDEQLQKLREAYDASPIVKKKVDDTTPFYSFDAYDHQCDMRNRSSILRTITPELCEAVEACLQPRLDELDKLMGHHWRIVQIWAHAYRNFEDPVFNDLSAANWHHDGCPTPIKKIFIYLDGASEDIGTTGFRTRQGKEFIFEGPPGAWALFEPAIIEHRAFVPEKAPRPAIEIEITPAFDTNPRVFPNSTNCGNPWFPFEDSSQIDDKYLPVDYTVEEVRQRTLTRWHMLTET
ncbi:MAG: hypothetical protein ACTSV1_09645, partial [Alphaproteobacteria bacterium]